MTTQKQNSAAIPVKALTVHGEAIAEKHTYFPIVDDFLRPGYDLQFDVYRRDSSNRLVLFLRKDMRVGSDIQEQIQMEHLKNRLYVRGDQRPVLLEHEERVLLEILNDQKTPIQQKCLAMQHVTVSLAQQVDQNPTSTNIRRQKRNIYRLVDFSLKEEFALRGLVHLADHDYYTYTHSVNVGLYGLTIAMAHFGHDIRHSLHEIASAFFLHDIGKCKVSSKIINKEGPLNEAEWMEMRKHPNYGQVILERENLLSNEMRIVVGQHHERLDGRGYPKGLTAREVHPYARICSVADAFDAMTTKRSYRNPYSAYEALKLMRRDIESQFDSTFYKVFVLQLHQGRQREARLQIVS